MKTIYKHPAGLTPSGFTAAALFTAALAFSTALAGCQQPPAQASAQTQTSGQFTLPDVIQVQNQERSVITVQSAESVKVVPDMAEIRFAIYTREKTADACQESNNKDLTNVIQFLKDFGFADESLQTSNYGMNPVYDWNSGRTITAYEMETHLTVSDIPIDQAGSLISSCIDAGINSIDRVSYLSSQYDACYQEALAKAIASAREKAQIMADAGGCALGAVVRVEEYSASQEVRYTGYAAAAADTNARKLSDMEMAVAPGQVSVEARISADFSIEPLP